MKIKITGKNGGDVREYWRAIRLAAQVTISDAIAGGRFLIRQIKADTARGLDYQGVPFEPYSPEYARRKGSSRVNLKVTGEMLGSLGISVNGRVYPLTARGTAKEAALSMGVGIYDNEEAARKGRIHNEGYLGRTGRALRPKGRLRGGVIHIPKRRWLDASPGTVKDIEQLIGERIEKRVQDAI